ncbi:MAG: xylosidase/arabinosidase [Phycisphaera sp.]|nr:xylosidase/arabinosidase [Phycisphaera sp.]
MEPYHGPTVEGVDTATLIGKIVVGYQGWFGTPNDGYGLGWKHYQSREGFKPGACTIDYWPHTRDFDPAWLEVTPFKKKDGSAALAYSSTTPGVVLKHFEWMRDYGIETAFLQRFSAVTRNPVLFRRNNKVLDNVRAAANATGRSYAVMYDLSGTPRNQMDSIKEDWKRLVDRMGITRDKHDKGYQYHRGKPVVALWGVGFSSENREYTLDECMDLIRFFKDDPTYGGTTVMLGVPTGWRTLDRDAMKDPKLHDAIRLADIVSPWTVGRFNSPDGVTTHAERYWLPDMAWCREAGLDYMPVVFPGFSWHNLKGAKLDAIPRLGGRFLWKQYATLMGNGADMIYQAMFDEIDEGTAICKVDNDPPIGASPFLTYKPQPEDHYMWLVGRAQQVLQNKAKLTPEIPMREAVIAPGPR